MDSYEQWTIYFFCFHFLFYFLLLLFLLGLGFRVTLKSQSHDHVSQKDIEGSRVMMSYNMFYIC